LSFLPPPKFKTIAAKRLSFANLHGTFRAYSFVIGEMLKLNNIMKTKYLWVLLPLALGFAACEPKDKVEPSPAITNTVSNNTPPPDLTVTNLPPTNTPPAQP